MRVAISGGVAPAGARWVIAVPRRSWKVSPVMSVVAQALLQDVRKPSLVHGVPPSVSGIVCVLMRPFGVSESSFSLSGAPTGGTTRLSVLPVFFRIDLRWIRRMWVLP